MGSNSIEKPTLTRHDRERVCFDEYLSAGRLDRTSPKSLVEQPRQNHLNAAYFRLEGH
jgi:hypothetical protein